MAVNWLLAVEARFQECQSPLECPPGYCVIAGAMLGSRVCAVMLADVWLDGMGPDTYAAVLIEAERHVQEWIIERATRLLAQGSGVPGGQVFLRSYRRHPGPSAGLLAPVVDLAVGEGGE